MIDMFVHFLKLNKVKYKVFLEYNNIFQNLSTIIVYLVS